MRRIMVVIAAGLLALLVSLASGGASPRADDGDGDGSGRARSAGTAVRTKTVVVRGSHVALRKLRKPPRPSATAVKWVEREEGEGAPQPDNPNELVDPPSTPPLTEDGARAAEVGDLEVFRSTSTRPSDVDSTDSVVEPTAANAGATTLVTGNWFDSVSNDNGQTYTQSIDPNKLWTKSLPGDGFCCDQSALKVDRGSHSLMMLVTMSNFTKNGNGVQVAVFDSRDGELDSADVKEANACTFTFAPPDFGFNSNRGFDYPQVGASDGFLYMSAVVFQALSANANGGLPHGSVAWRMDLDTIESECRQASPQLRADSFTDNGSSDPLLPVNNAGSTMFLARHKDSPTSTDKVRVWKWPDSSASPTKFDRNIANWPEREKKQKCKIDSSKVNPCGRDDGRLQVGFRSGSTVGWVWTAAQGNPIGAEGFKWPHIRAVAFDTGTVNLVEDTQIHSDNYAVDYPSVAVSASGKLAVTYYRMGGGFNPQARAFIVNDPRNWPAAPKTSSLNINSSAGPTDDKWGDYESVHAYDGCPNSFLAAFEMVTSNKKVQARTVWFGEPGTQCPDYRPSDIIFSPTRTPIIGGDQFNGGVTTVNDGATAGSESRTVFYLSHDKKPPPPTAGGRTAATVSDQTDDFRLTPTFYVQALGAGESKTGLQTFTMPDRATGTYHLIACADDLTRLTELDEKNNCSVYPSEGSGDPLISVTAKIPVFDSSVAEADVEKPSKATGGKSKLSVTLESEGGTPGSLAKSVVVVDAGPTPGFGQDGITLGIQSTTPGKVTASSAARRLRQRRTLTLRVPSKVRAGQWYLRVCLRRPAGARDDRFENDCRVTKRPVALRPG